MELEIISMTPQERMYSYSQSSQIEAQAGCIGHLRGDFGSGRQFYTSWFDHHGEYKTDEFKSEFDEVVNSLREKDGLFFSRDSMIHYCRQRPEAEMVGNYCTEYGFKLKTAQHTYTPPVVIRGIYKALSQMGFQQGNILEPACGTGNFIGLLPADMAGSKAYGVEIDSISGRIAQQLYQNASISVNGFETVQMPDSFFDVAIGNVPFGDFKVVDRRYDKHHWLIHDYFFGKALDKVRPGGIIAFITSKGTMDKENSAVRRYLAQRADLIGAIRLPDNTFKQNAGTEVTSDILFLQKRDHITDLEQDWVQLDTDENGIRMNRYFVQHPEMVLGDMVMESTRFGMDSACKAREGADLSEQLAEAIQFLQAEIKPYELEEPDEEEDRSIPADPTVRNFSYTIVDGHVYYRENSLMHPMEVSVTAENRIRGMIELRECVRRLIEYQTEGYSDEDIQAEQKKLNSLYDSFTAKYGLISSRGNKLAFSEDSSYCLLCSLEVLDEQGRLSDRPHGGNSILCDPPGGEGAAL